MSDFLRALGRLMTASAVLASLLTGCRETKEDEASLRRHEVTKQIDRLSEEVVKLRRKVEGALNVEGVRRPHAPAAEADRGVATQADLERALNPLRQDLMDLALTVNRLAPRKASASPERSFRTGVSSSGEIVSIQVTHPLRNRTVTIRNRGQDVVVNPRVIANGRRDWFSTASVLHDALKPGMSDREKAIAIWEFLRDNRLHGYPAHDAIEVHDPVRFLNVYGYGFCDDSATNFMLLAEQAGLQARVWGLEGHVVPEAYFDGAWHMLDPDGEVYYLDDDGKTISSVETLQKRPDIIRKYGSPFYSDTEKLVSTYTTAADNEVSTFYREVSETRHTMGILLRPGESLMRSWDNWGKYFAERYLDEPKRYGNGKLVFEPIFAEDLFRKGAEAVDGIRAESARDGWALVPAQSGKVGTLVYRFASPYPILDGTVEVDREVRGGGRVEVAFSETGESWQTVWSADSTGASEVPIGGHIRNGYGRPVYAYLLRLSLSASEGAAVRVHRLRFSSDIQVAPQALPALETGENRVLYVDDTPGSRDVEIGFEYDEE